MRRSKLRCDKNRSICSRSRSCTGLGAWRSARQRVGHELADAQQEFGAHAGMKAFRIARTDGQNAERALLAQGRERHRTDGHRLSAEQVVALRIPYLAAARLSGTQQG